MAPRRGPGKISPIGFHFSFQESNFFAICAKGGNWVK